MSSERLYTPRDPEFSFIAMASMFAGSKFPDTESGFTNARVLFGDQHTKVMPPADNITLFQIVQDQDSILNTTEQMGAIAIESDDYEASLIAANHLFAYGEISYQDSLGEAAFNLSLSTHRRLAERIRRGYGLKDPYLRVASGRLFADIEKAKQARDFHRELQLLRGGIHMVVLNGTLGEKAKQQFDPYAIADIR